MVFLPICLLFLLCSFSMYGEHKIIYLVSPPRSLSTAFLRMMHSRGDFMIFNEPSQYAYIKMFFPEFAHSYFRTNAYQSFSDVKKALLDAAEHQNVFAKEMSFAVKDFHENDTSIMRMPNVHFVFLVRNPHHTLISMYRKIAPVVAEGKAKFDDVFKVVRYDQLCDFIEIVAAHAYNKPYVIYAEDLYLDAQNTIKSYCDHIGIPFDTAQLHWHSLTTDFDGVKEWHTAGYQKTISHWHLDAILSSGFEQKNTYAIDDDGNPTFAEIEHEEHRAVYKKIYREQYQYYTRMKQLVHELKEN